MNAAAISRRGRVFTVGLGLAALLLLVAFAAEAKDFDWVPEFNIAAQADPSGFRARIAARFRIGDAEIDAVLRDVHDPADAYLVFRFGEMAHRPPAYVVEHYKGGKKKGWGALAKSLGIKPGSPEFHALKSGHDLSDDGWGKAKKGKGKSKDKGKGKKNKD
jgi:hypothetical protein